MVIRLNPGEVRILKESLDGPLELPEGFCDESFIKIYSGPAYYYISGPKAALFELLYRLSTKYQIEIL